MKGYRWLSLGAVSAITALSASAASPAAATAVAARPAAGSACAGVLVPEPDPLSLGGATTVCKPVGLETPADLMKAQSYDAARQLAPYTGYRPEALRAAVADKQALYANQATVPNATGSWSGIGQPPLHNDSTSPAYNQAPPPISNQNQLGWPMLSGRVTSVAYDTARAGRWFLSSGGGGVWETTDAGASWRSIGDSLPVQIIGAMAFSPAFGGTLIAGSGDNATGTFGQPGLGVFRSVDDGASWQTANGIPDGILTYRITVDPTNATTVYAATSKGLYRSTDDGQSYTNVLLPTTCVTYLDAKCFFANFVTDVVVRPNDSNGHGGGKVLAAVGWRLGQAKDADGTTVQAPQNGIYESDSGLPTTFHFIDPGNGPGIGTNGFSSTPNVGRVSLGIAHGAAQNHDVVYALVSNAVAMQNCAAAADLDTPLCNTNVPTATATFLEGAFASTDFGVTWKQIMDPLTLKNPDSGSALVGLAGYSPGIQSWYNTYIDPDPTVQDPTGVPTRVIVGLEEVWENDQNVEGTTTTAATTWHTISRYWNACTGNFNGIVCSANTQAGLGGVTAGTTTEHPDHHGEAFIPDATGGGVTLLEGNDGGVWKQHIASGADFNNDQWANGVNNGLQTVETYNASISKDGTIIAGLQDNGLMRIDGKTGREDMIFGGDAFLSYVDPTNSQNMIEEYVNGIANYTIDGGQHWCFIDPQLVKPFGEAPLIMDHTDPNHVLIAGQDVQESTAAFAAPTGACDPSAT
ncbi:MAG TPA: hypothetical protein VG245_07205, partial [Candidatus Dormibacteraeota bacterium]|nr:hypothetical protein [Candidatus Dormibacteraeota bacterium]